MFLWKCNKHVFYVFYLQINVFNIYAEDDDSYDVGLTGREIFNQPSAVEWHRKLWPTLTLNPKFKVITL